MPIAQVLSSANAPVKIWTNEIESSAYDQLKNTAALPFVFKWVAAMPDVHWGKGATVGSVIASKTAVCPACVGVDIGCGMITVKTELNYKKVLDHLDLLYDKIVEEIPVGRESNKKVSSVVLNWSGWQSWADLSLFDESAKSRALSQLGSLGGGNHFIEICLDEENNVWVMLHSGSRNVGKTLAEYHIDKAKGLMKKMFISLPDPDLAYVVQGTAEFTQYMHDLRWAQDYAFQNRVEMMTRVKRILADLFNDGERLPVSSEINCHHNYVAEEVHYGEKVLVTRKGAIKAHLGDLGIIPGSMGACSYIVEGLGNKDSFMSAPHGAGRKMSRNQAKKQFTVDDLRQQTEGVKCRKDEGIVDEIPGAYKSIDTVIENSSDLVKVVAKLKQVLCVKG